MALWLVRAGANGEHEQKFLEENRAYVTWDGLNVDLSTLPDVAAFRTAMQNQYPSFGVKKIINHTSQIRPFVVEMKPGDWLVTPSKSKSAIHIGEITGPYVYNSVGPDPYFHYRNVKWIAKDIPRESFAQDLLYSFGAFMTICEVRRNDAEARVRAMGANGWKKETVAAAIATAGSADDVDGVPIDLEQLAQDAIAKLIMARFKGHKLAELVDAILRAQGYVTHLSPPGPDKGIDILAAPGPLGFGQPRICVQVKSEQSPVDSPTLNQLIGAMQNVHADQGLLVSWGGFKSSIEKEIPAQFFRVRLWNQAKLVEELVEHYDRLDAQIRAELPLKRIWTVATDDDDE
jgi:restriction system protein